MAKQKDAQPINATVLSETLSIPYKFLKDTSEIKINDILELFNDSIADEECVLGIGFCKGADNIGSKCALHDQWIESKVLLQKMFRESSIADITKQGTKI